MTSLHGFRAAATCLVASVLVSGCVAYSYPGGPPRYYSPAVDVPPGHMPPPGKCRIWFPGEPPGQQPPPGDCYDLQRRVPSGAVLVRG
jgi:hypothetical protein